MVVRQTPEETTIDVRVLWKANAYADKRIEFHAKQIWTLIREQGVIKIKKYIVAEDANGHVSPSLPLLMHSNQNSTLSCICYGGPGNYRYACAPVTTTCHGGPGNYPYSCLVCP